MTLTAEGYEARNARSERYIDDIRRLRHDAKSAWLILLTVTGYMLVPVGGLASIWVVSWFLMNMPQ